MHEMSLLRSLVKQIETVARNHGAERVRAVRLKLGPLAHIEPDHLREHFVDAVRGTLAEGARLDIDETDDLHELSLENIEIVCRPDVEPMPPAADHLPSGDGSVVGRATGDRGNGS
jgi:hydrogenase nickel incorporation protein HypA/HybF